MASSNGRVNIPKSPKELLELAKTIYAKHQADGTTSKLNGLEGYDWDAVGPTIISCLEKTVLADELSKKAESAYNDRNQLLGPIEDITRKSSQMLKGIFPNNPKKLLEWGYDVSDTVKPTTASAKKALV